MSGFDPNGSLATTHKNKVRIWVCLGISWLSYDELVDSEMHIGAAGIKVKINIKDIQAEHRIPIVTLKTLGGLR